MKFLGTTLQKIVLFSFTLLSINVLANGATCTFTNGSGDNLWSTASNWSTAFVPDSDDDVIVNAGSLSIDLDITVKSMTITNGASVEFTENGTSYIGDLQINGGALESNTELVISTSFTWNGTSTSSLTNTNTIELASTCSSVIEGSGNRNLYAPIINNGTLSHTGGSLRFQSGGSFENNGTYTIDGATFIINTGGNGFTNKGTVNKNGTSELSFFRNNNYRRYSQCKRNDSNIWR